MNPKDSWLLDWDEDFEADANEDFEDREFRQRMAKLPMMMSSFLQPQKSEQKEDASAKRRSLIEDTERVGPLTVELPNTKENTQRVLEFLENMTFEEMANIIQIDYLCAEDAGGQYLVAVKQEFVDMVRKIFRSATHHSVFYHPYNYALYPLAGDIRLTAMDPSDKYDILMSIVDDDYAENVNDVEVALRKFTSNITYVLWNAALA